MREELNYLYKQINQPGNHRLPQLQKELQDRENKVLEVTRQLHHRRESAASPLQSFDVQQLQQQLSENDALVEYTALGDELLAFVVLRDRIHVVRNLASLEKLAERLAALRAVTQQLIPGRWDCLREPSRKELAATAVLALPLAEASVKIRTGPPADDPDDLEAGIWAGVVPIAVTFGEPEPDAALRPGTLVPDHIAALGSGRSTG